MLFKDTIGIFPNALTPAFCRELITHFHQYSNYHQQGISGGNVHTEVKNSIDWDILEGRERNSYFSDTIINTANELILQYVESFGKQSQFDTGLLFNEGTGYPSWVVQWYRKNEGHFQHYHTESNHPNYRGRLFAIMFYLNTVHEGGETEFLYPGYKIKPTAGTFVIWPAGWPYVHRGLMPVSNDKYIITSWLVGKVNQP